MQTGTLEYIRVTSDRSQPSQNRGRPAHVCQKLVEVLITQSIPLLGKNTQRKIG